VIKAEFPASVLHSSVSHDPSEITLNMWSNLPLYGEILQEFV